MRIGSRGPRILACAQPARGELGLYRIRLEAGDAERRMPARIVIGIGVAADAVTALTGFLRHNGPANALGESAGSTYRHTRESGTSQTTRTATSAIDFPRSKSTRSGGPVNPPAGGCDAAHT